MLPQRCRPPVVLLRSLSPSLRQSLGRRYHSKLLHPRHHKRSAPAFGRARLFQFPVADVRMLSNESTLSLAQRLQLFKFTRTSLHEAGNGKRVPLQLGSGQAQTSVIRGIRHHDGFGTDLRGYAPFDRALNARAIMSNRIPDINDISQVPYCIWYPEVAREDTYRSLVERYPFMKYQVGRACAVAGYTSLYRELDLLPDVGIAEEAQDNKSNGRSGLIFDDIMSKTTLYSVMNDYTRSINLDQPKRDAYLNADTAVRSSLTNRQCYDDTQHTEDEPPASYAGLSPQQVLAKYLPLRDGDHYWNITEDWKFDDSEVAWEDQLPASPDLRLPLLYSPLPKHLPNINKDVLIYHAAYTGNIDRYSRLKRPVEIDDEFEQEAVIQGILHHTAFAKWWSTRDEILKLQSQPGHPHVHEIRAINARFIMNNNISHISENTPEDQLPYQIYWPNIASERVYRALYHRKPSMKMQIARACIIANYETLYRDLDPDGDESLMLEASFSSNSFFAEHQTGKNMEFRHPNTHWNALYHEKPIKDLLNRQLYASTRVVDGGEEDEPLPLLWTTTVPDAESDYHVELKDIEEAISLSTTSRKHV